MKESQPEERQQTLLTKVFIKDGEYFYDEDDVFKFQTPKFFKRRIEEKISEEEKKLFELNEEIKKIERIIEEKKLELEKLEENIVKEAEKKSDSIIEEAERVAFNKIKSSLEEKSINVQEAEKDKAKIIQEGHLEAQKIIQEAHEEAQKIRKDAYQQGFEKGLDDGFKNGQDEVKLLVDRLKDIVSYIVNKRTEIVEKSEREVVELALEVVRKVIKQLTDSEKDIVIRQIKYALSKLSGSTTIVIRVNPKDLDITTKHKEEFMSLLESIQNIRIFEDSFVDHGGCIIETDTTSIDARIISQLEDLENKIKSILP